MNASKSVIIEALARLMPKRLKDSLFHLAFNLSPKEFEKFSYQYNFAPNMAYGLRAMRDRGYSPGTIVDVGAFQGDWSVMANELWPRSQLIMIEPNRSRQPKVLQTANKLSAALFDDLLGAEDGLIVPFNVMESGSSVMNERSAVPRITEKRTLKTLDSLVQNIKPNGFLKIDAQGYELQILNGAKRLLPSFDAVLLEVAIIEINEGAPLMHEVLTYMRAAGFITYDILGIHRRPLDGALNQVDVVFIREDSSLIADKRHFA